jgi:uncharacterized protein (TIGR02421 family)
MSVDEIDLSIDRALTEVAGRLPMLLLLTPINEPEARRAFFEGTEADPEFRYAPLPDLDTIAGELAEIHPDDAADPVLAHMARDLHRELERRIDLLRARGTDRFLVAAVEEYGHVDEPLVEMAEAILDAFPRRRRTRERLDAGQVAVLMQREVDHYRRLFPELAARVLVSETAVGVMVENGDVFIGADTTIDADRVEQLVQHEIGVHVLTHANGAVQPIRMLSLGLAGYEETQEALGVLAEHLTGGLKPRRLRILALRVIAARSVTDGDSFRRTYDLLRERGSDRQLCFTTALRAHRSGGMTKDALYLGGLDRLLQYLRQGSPLDSLLVGKMSLAYEPLVAELLERGVLVAPPLRPRFLDFADTRRRLAEIRSGATLLELGAAAA